MSAVPNESTPGYLTMEQVVSIAGVDDLVIRSLLDRQQFADPDGEAQRIGISSAAWPLFGMLWPSTAQLASRLGRHPVAAGERILEIGCGLGLASLVAHRRGADITASDCHPLAGEFLAENLRLNGLPPMKYRHGDWQAIDLGEARRDGEGRLRVHGRFDLVVGSDLLYERDAKAVLAEFIARHAAPAAEVWIVDPDRGNRAAFTRQMGERGFSVTEERLDRVATDACGAYKGRMLTYRRDGRSPPSA